jgi:hypothetical protein
MLQVHEGQCGMCVHFGEHTSDQPQLIQIRLRHEAPDNLVEPCGLPENEKLNLKVTPISGCQGFEPASETPHA